MSQITCFSYWGKASPEQAGSAKFHLLVFHALDVAACGRALLALPQFSLENLANELNWPLEVVDGLFVFFLVLHDLGKFARGFQALVPDLSPHLVPALGKPYLKRHDTLSWLFWRDILAEGFPADALPGSDSEFWAVWMRTAAGHHGRPPEDAEGGGLIALAAEDYFLREDRRAAWEFVEHVVAWLLPGGIPKPGRGQDKILCRHAWRLAGLAVLADWLGSNQAFFSYRSTPLELVEYWQAQALPQATRAVTHAGLEAQPIRHWERPEAVFDYLHKPTPLQRYAAEVPLETGPQLFLLEDVTGAGKTEAALILTQRLMQAGLGGGLYFALPSMATANQMYQRVGQVYRHLYGEAANPSLILAHGARGLIEGFRQSVLQPSEQPADRSYACEDISATAQCNAWLADSRKKALLAEIGVGTLDQALLAVLPVRHQSLRLLGLVGKVLLVDEVHAYDPYLMTLLKLLLTAHARQGGCAILLSATLPLAIRDELLAAYRCGRGASAEPLPDDRRYPLATQVGPRVDHYGCETRPQLKRRVQVQGLHDETAAFVLVIEQARAGHCVCWIRNTVEDARRAYESLGKTLPPEDLLLFHSRFAMGDRLDIEDRVLACFGKHSTGAERRGKVLIGTQVLEQSLDFCVDAMISDLAPIDLLIQRAGRLQRHARLANGAPAPDGVERREPPVLHVFGPEPVDKPAGDWYCALFPKACFVYPDAGQLWLGARALARAGCIASPGQPGEVGAVRGLVEAVYGEETETIPDSLQRASLEQKGKDLALESQAWFNALKLDKGYCADSSGRWYEDTRIPTRLGDETLTLYLARDVNGELRPLREGGSHPWEQSAVRIDARRAEKLAPDWEARFATALQTLRERCRLLAEPAFVLPLAQGAGAVLSGKVVDKRGHVLEMRYDPVIGLRWH
ncbi:CRISPR-associated helicase Cas3' [Azomonas macrocytogenes]|uniref:CRISPR-associated endonuclease/helicase Cas3 n=1 Tax=Azomonas macrocytogenes TaxID=69962 RepID=A0A839SZR0_AZOMA|nr:CRISPR-associated helicase Cas3' [Azomonas macrocytogenes]MBB3101736.1 CRISPR-associated endonuclease/helicase Cas3 [Azomonas macrocytogenes]